VSGESLKLTINEAAEVVRPGGITINDAAPPVYIRIHEGAESRKVAVTLAENDAAARHIIMAVDKKELPMEMGVEKVRVIHDGEPEYPHYSGGTTVTPSVEDQILSTRRKVVMDDITVSAIPYHETSNTSGGYTAIIGG